MVRDNNLPTFDLHSYKTLLGTLQNCGYIFSKVSQMGHGTDRPIVFLRHDVDLHIYGLDQMAKIESDAGVQATYYVPLTLHFNPLYPANVQILRKLLELGH